MCEDLELVRSWADVILVLYSVTDSDSYVTATLAHKHINNNNTTTTTSVCASGSGSGQPNRKVSGGDRISLREYNNNQPVQDSSGRSPCVILVGNKNDLWQDRQVGTDQACQEAEEAGCSNFYEITTRESLDQVRVVFFEGVRRGLASGDHRGHRRLRSISTESPCLHETSPESEELSPTISPSPKTKIIVSKHIMASIMRKLMSKSVSVVLLFG